MPQRMLTDDSTSDSLVTATRENLLEAIIRPLPDSKLSILLNDLSRADSVLRNELQKAPTDKTSRQQSLRWLQRVELATLRSELFPEKSPDGIAAANEAARIAEASLLALPASGSARSEVLRLLAEAHLRRGDLQSAQVVLEDMNASAAKTAGPNGSNQESHDIAMQVRIAIAAGNQSTAKDLLEDYYSQHTSRRLNMDLVRLRYLLRFGSETQVANWLDSISQTHGEDAGDRASTIVSQTRLTDGEGVSSASSANPERDPRLWIADAMYYLRKEKSQQAALHFARAAISDQDDRRSIQSALKAAAILVQSGNSKASVELLQRISDSHTQSSDAAGALLQAATIAHDHADEFTAEEIRTMLQRVAGRWPNTDAALAANRWLIAWNRNEANWLAAAIQTTKIAVRHWRENSSTAPSGTETHASQSVRSLCLLCWSDAWMHEPDAKTVDLLHRSFADAVPASLPARTHADLTVLLDDPTSRASQATEGFFRELAKFRLGQSVSVTSQPPQAVTTALIQRLEMDARQQPERRVAIGRCLIDLDRKHSLFASEIEPGDSSAWRETVHRVGWHIWAGERSTAETIVKEAIERNADAANDLFRQSARAHSISPSKADQARAATWWKRLADNQTRGSHEWYASTLGWLDALKRSGKTKEASASARMILLTTPPQSAEQAAAFENAAK
ncbi:hypothetical protein LOC71_01625 [Rhodopirellula sp. JC740]|uniref:Uncharacterized protein n=1 Tax=Rhodopirellula halodulae TaxID=2894198 RepID=A0ABS8NBL9_9BACT|nr:hypothetical protein [Rhodopirellula sp. JC740]MCC9640955.1 hypothetical protein [Rhodopirellula sp. JC740]